MDFDGTLSPLVRRPHLAKFSPPLKRLVRKFVSHPAWRVGIVSGRDMATIKRKAGLTGIFYAGNHGFEIQLPGRNVIVHPAAKKARGTLTKICRQLRRDFKRVPGVLIENKTFSASLHTRTLKPSREKTVLALARRRLSSYIKNKQIRVTRGKKVLEIRPPAKWDKGKAVLYILGRIKTSGFVVYVGDDSTDEDAFKALNRRGLAVRVGRAPRTRAHLCLDTIRQMPAFLNELLRTGPTC